MIVGFATRGQGRGAGPVGYCVQETVTQAKKGTHTRTPPPTVLRGDPAATERLIDSLDFTYKYKSGVLSFAPGETITPEMERDIMDRFEAVAFAGLDRDAYDILWVRHEHAGHHELHFVTPRVELTTGKSLNICPPGRGARQAYDDFRSMINAEHGLADPDDPARERDIQHAPGDRRAVAWESLGMPEGVAAAKRRLELRELAHSLISKRVEAGLIRDRSTLVEQVKELGFQVPRQGRDSITLLHPDDPDGTRVRMKGAIYGARWELEQSVERANQPRERDYTNRDATAARRYAERVEQHIQRRADYHRSRYAPRELEHGEALPALDAVAEPRAGDDLNRYIGRGLGVDAVPVPADRAAAADAGQSGSPGRGSGADGAGPGVPVVAGGGDDQRAEADPRGAAIRGAEEVADDGAGADIARRIAAIRAAADRAAEGARQCARRAGACLGRVRAVEPASEHLAAAVSRFEWLILDWEAERLEQREIPEPAAEPRRERWEGPTPGPVRNGWEPPSM